jgi:hypothetical protein
VNDRPGIVKKEQQQLRLRAALRENLRRRKAQAKGRVARKPLDDEPHDSAGIGDDKEKS